MVRAFVCFLYKSSHQFLGQRAGHVTCGWDQSTCACAAEGGQLEVLKWARENGCPWDESTTLCAAREVNLCLLRHSHTHMHTHTHMFAHVVYTHVFLAYSSNRSITHW